ncbi:MAG: Fic family protein [Spirochaetes bacterium]|nr:Fic family protein [Spirochaetota bacterium]
MDPSVPANDLPRLPPAVDVESKATLKEAIAANRELARLKEYCSRLPNEAILLDTIVLKEARASSEIENIVTTHDELYRALTVRDEQIGPETKEVLNYRSAMWNGVALLREHNLITTRMIMRMQEVLERNTAGVRTLPGTALKNDLTGETVYTPPDNEKTIRDLLANLEHYTNTESETDPLVKIAIIHYQFESIHPFYDGNGRTGRMLNVLYLMKEGLLDTPILYLSRHIIENKPTYYALLQNVRNEGAWEEWIRFMLAAVESTSRLTLDTAKRIVAVLEETAERARRELPKSTYSKELIEAIFVQPYVKIEHLVRAGIAERRTASKYLKQLEELGVLESYRAWRETIYLNTRLMEVIRESE